MLALSIRLVDVLQLRCLVSLAEFPDLLEHVLKLLGSLGQCCTRCNDLATDDC